MTHRTTTGLSVALLVATLFSFAAPALADRREELKAAFAARREAIDAAKAEGKLGETFRGYIETVTREALNDAKVKGLMEAENADRRETYEDIARRIGATTADVAARGAAKHFEKARPGDYLKHADGQWRKKA
jgi:uncharacterized protein YdbL (DUF1318 family)